MIHTVCLFRLTHHLFIKPHNQLHVSAVVSHTEAVYKHLVAKRGCTTVITLVYNCLILLYGCTEPENGLTQPKRVAVIGDFNEEMLCSAVSLCMDQIYNVLD